MFLATLSRDGEPVAAAFGPALDERGALVIHGGRLEVGLFMIRQGVAETALDFENPETGQRFRAKLPPEGLGLTADGFTENLSLEVIPV